MLRLVRCARRSFPTAGVWLLHRIGGHSFDEILTQYFGTPLRELRAQLVDMLGQHTPLIPQAIQAHLDTFELHLRKPARAASGWRGRSAFNTDGSEKRVGDATLADFFEADVKVLEQAVDATTRQVKSLRFRWAAPPVFTQIERAYRKAIHNFIASRLWWNEAAAKDVAQETWLAAFRSWRTFDPRQSSVLAFLKGIAKRRRKAYLRKERRWRKKLVPLEEWSETDDPPTALAGSFHGRSLYETCDRDAVNRVHLRLLTLALDLEFPLFKTLAFVAVRLLGKTPRALVAAWRKRPLRRLLKEVERALLDQSGLPEAEVRRCFVLLWRQLDEPFEQALKGAHNREDYAPLRSQPVAQWHFDECYALADRDLEAQAERISEWAREVMRRLVLVASKDAELKKALRDAGLWP